MLSTINSELHHSWLYYVSHSSESEKSLLWMFIGISSEFQVRCGTDVTRSTYYTWSDIHEIVTCYKWLSLKLFINLCHPDAVVLITKSQEDSIASTLNDSCCKDVRIQSTRKISNDFL